MKIDIKKMQEYHINALVNLEKSCFTEPWSENSLKSELNNKNAYFIVAQNNNKILGYTGMYCILDECYITNIAVSPKYRNLKVGSSLIENLIDHAKKSNCTFITLEVRKSNITAINLYKKFNFAEVGCRKNFYKNPTEDASIMTLYLKGV